MKNFFSNLFGQKSNSKSIATEVMEKSESAAEPVVPYNLFVDNNHPYFENEKTAKVKSALSIFLSKNFFADGLRDGYELHSVDFLNKNTDAMATDFRFLLDKEIQRTKAEMNDLRIELAHLGDKLPALKEALQIRIEEMEMHLADYVEHKEKSVDFEGWFSMPVRNYQRGFEAGHSKYLNEKKLMSDIGIY